MTVRDTTLTEIHFKNPETVQVAGVKTGQSLLSSRLEDLNRLTHDLTRLREILWHLVLHLSQQILRPVLL